MPEIVIPFLRWYLVTQVVTIAAMPLTLHYFRYLPDRGYAFARILGILLVSFLLWFGASYGLLRNTSGGAWLALLLVALLSLWAISRQSGARTGPGEPVEGRASDSRFTFHLSRLRSLLPPWPYLLTVELLFFLAFAAWTWVRAYDPAINHTEQPMDLMFMNGIWTSADYPPRDPWLAGYAISYYYFGYWMVMVLARIAGQPPEIAYNVGQACWFGLLLSGSFGIGYNLLRSQAQEEAADAAPAGGRPFEDSDIQASHEGRRESQSRLFKPRSAVAAGLLTAVAVGLTGNLQVILEWLYAQGVPLDSLIRLVEVRNFPEQAPVTGLWYIDNGWSWWWRASRVIEDIDLTGNHIEIIDEFPIFSYVLGDNHPHVLAMPFVLLVIAMALNWFLGDAESRRGKDAEATAPTRNVTSRFLNSLVSHLRSLFTAMPLGPAGVLLLIAATGALVFLNTWDFPPYWLLLLLVALFTGARQGQPQGRPAQPPSFRASLRRSIAPLRRSLARGGIGAGLLLLGTLLLYLPYFLTAQSQAGGILPNLFHPTRLPQFLLMFGHFLLAVVGLLGITWREQPPSATTVATAAALMLGLPVIFLLISRPLADMNAGQLMMQRRLSQPWTFLLMGSLFALSLALLWQRLVEPGKASPTTTFVLFLVAIGALLTYAPEFVYLRDNFGTRMNTVFKFYYQGWLLLGIASAYTIAGGGLIAQRACARGTKVRTAEHSNRQAARARQLPEAGSAEANPARTPYRLHSIHYAERVASALSLLLILACLIYPVAGAYAKITGFGTRQPTLDGIAYVGADEQALIDWIRRNTAPDAVILEAKGVSYRGDLARISATTGRATLLGWDSHESQWRGDAYAEMAAGRAEATQEIYQRPDPETLPKLLHRWQIDYVLVGPAERAQYGITPQLEERLLQILDVVFEQGAYRIYQ